MAQTQDSLELDKIDRMHGSDPPAPPPLIRRLSDPKTLLSFGLGLAILVFFLSRFDVDFYAVWEQLQRTDPILFVAALAVYYSTFAARSLRWRKLLENAMPVKSRRWPVPGLLGLTHILLVSWLVNCVLPAKLGDAYRSYLLKVRVGGSFSLAVGTVFAERALDLLTLFLLLIVSAVLAFGSRLPSASEPVLGFGLSLASAVIGGLLAMRHFGNRIEALLPLRLKPIYRRLQEGTLGAFTAGAVPLLASTSVSVWILEASRLLLISRALHTDLPLALALFVALAGSLLTAVPALPGGLGLVESGTIAVLLWFGVDQNLAVSMAFLDRLISYWSVILVGLVAYLIPQK
jgi:uncharacterized protein (TIRG00374 family)